MLRMRQIIMVLVMCSVVMLGSTLVCAADDGQILFTDEFTGDLSKWFLDSTTDGKPEYFSVADGAMEFAPVWFGNAFAGDAKWTDYALEVDFEILQYGRAGSLRLFVHSNKLWEGYGMTFKSDGIYMGRFDGNWNKHTILKQLAKGTPEGQRVQVRIEVRGNRLKLFYSGELLGEVEDPKSAYLTGGIGLRSDHSSIRVYSVTVRSLGQ